MKMHILRKKTFRDPIFWLAFCGVAGFILVSLAFFCTDGKLIDNYFWIDPSDTAMDWMNSVRDTSGGKPYSEHNTLYPPLANLFFFLIYNLTPLNIRQTNMDRGTAFDLRLYQGGLLPFLLFVLIASAVFYILVQKVLNQQGHNRAFVVAFVLVTCFPFLYAIERGNIIILAFLGSLFFLMYYDHRNGFVREIACIILALAAGIKLFPAFLGILLLREHRWQQAVRTVIYGIAALIVPCFFFKEGLDGLLAFFQILFKWGNRTTDLNVLGCGIKDIVYSCILVASKLTGISEYAFYPFLEKMQIVAYLLCAVLLILSLILKMKKWKSVLVISLVMVSIQKAPYYTLIYLLLPFLLFLKEEETLNKKNCAYFVLLLLLTMNIPTFDLVGILKIKALHLQICVALLWITLLFDLFVNRKKRTVRVEGREQNGKW